MKRAMCGVSLAGLGLTMAMPVMAQWENLNPGAGGRIQDIVLDPNTPGRAYYLSDMEGVSRTDDHGQSWTYLGWDVAYPNTLTATVEPGNADRVYLGSVGGLEVSDDAGQTWRPASGVSDPITQIAVHPDRTDRIFAIPGNKMRWKHNPTKHEANPFGRRVLYISEDRGQSWQPSVFDPGQGRRDTFTIDIDPTDPDTVYLSALAGVFVSKDGGRQWTKLPQPKETGDSWGAGLSADGKYLFVAFQVPDAQGQMRRATGMGEPSRVPTKVFVTATEEVRWQECRGLPQEHARGEDGQVKQFWNPEVDPASGDKGVYRVLTSSVADRSGLWQINATLREGKLRDSRWERVFYYGGYGKQAEFDHGWEQYSTRPLAWQFIPASWGQDGLWTTGDQTLYRVERDGKGWQQRWEALYTQFVKELEGVRFYRTRGVQCTFVFEGTGDGDYVVQANADNAVKESYDDGVSWAVGIVQPRSNAVTIVRDVQPKIVLAHTSPGYGASANAGTLWAKRLEHRSPKDPWKQVGGGPSQRGGLPNTLYDQIATDPHQPGRVFVGTFDRGVYVIDDIEAFIEGKGDAQARCISGPDLGEQATGPDRAADKGQGMVIDPHTPGRLWVADTKVLWRGDEQPDGAWQWTQVREGVFQVAGWSLNGQTALAAVVASENGRDEALVISTDSARTWNGRVEFTEHIQPRVERSWYSPQDYAMQARSPVGHGNDVYVAFGDPSRNRPYGYFAVRVQSDGSVAGVQDITRDMPYPMPVESRVIDDGRGPALYVGTWGNGLWRLRLSSLEGVQP